MKTFLSVLALLHALDILSLCAAESYFELVTHSTALPETFDISTVFSRIDCCMTCDILDQCVTVGYNAKSRQCLLSGTTTVTVGTVQTIEPTGFQVFSKRFVRSLKLLLFSYCFTG